MYKALILLILFALPGSLQAATWDDLNDSRPILSWESLYGYRLFFHPDHSDRLRQALVVGVKKRENLQVAFALARPWHIDSPRDTWLRIEGNFSNNKDYVSLDWNGVYLGKEFPDKRYYYDVSAKNRGEAVRNWKVAAVKSLDHPRFTKIGGQNIKPRNLDWDKDKGEFKPIGNDVFISRRENSQVDIRAKVWLPDLDEDFKIDGVLIQARQIEDEVALAPVQDARWQCICQQEIPKDSPARQKLKTVRCIWNLEDFAGGVWELRVGLWHQLKHSRKVSPCDVPVLDEDRVQITVRP